MQTELFPEGCTLVFGSTGGIGRAVAREFAAAGSDIALSWRSKTDVANNISQGIKDVGRNVSSHQCDVTVLDDIQTCISEAIGAHGRIHTLVWGAGPLVEQVLISESSREQWHNAVNVEVHGFFDVVKCVLPHMREQGGGSIVHLGSAGELSFPPKDYLSVCPKAANESLIKGIAREEGVHNIRANSVLIGVIEAGMFLELTQQGVFDETWVNEVQKNLALKRWGKPEEVANAAVFLASNNALYVTGQQIAVAGGYGL